MMAWAIAEFPPATLTIDGSVSSVSTISRESAKENEVNGFLRPVAASFAARAAEGVASPQQLATTARAFAKLGALDTGLMVMDAVAEACLALPEPLEDRVLPQDVANLLWAFAKLQLGEKETHVRAFAALAKAARARLRAARKKNARSPSSDEETRTNALNALNALNGPSASLSYTSQQLTMVVWSHGALARADAKTLDALLSAVRLALPTFSARDLSDTAWAFAALGVTSASKPKLIARMGRAARRQLPTFNAQELLRFLGAFERLGGSDAKLAEAVRKKRSTTYDFPALAEVVGSKRRGVEKSESVFPSAPLSGKSDLAFCSVALASTTPQSFKGTQKERSRVDDSCGGWGRGNTGVALWEGSFVLAEWLSRQTDPSRSKDVTAAAGEVWGGDGGWEGKTGVELGAGLGLPSIVASKLGVEMIATDGASRKKVRVGFFFRFFGETRLFVAKKSPSLIPPQDLSVSSEFQEGRT